MINCRVNAIPDTTYINISDNQWRCREGITFSSNDASGKNWTDNGYDEGVSLPWLTGTTPIGYGDGDDNTVLSGMQNNYITFFMRREFTIPSGQVPSTLTLRALYDDGLAIFINGVEVTRYSLFFECWDHSFSSSYGIRE